MKKFNLMMWQGLVLSALALGFASCEPSDKPCPNKKGAETNTDQGVTVMLEMENVVTGETTRTALGENGYNFTPINGGGDVQAKNLGFYRKLKESDNIYVNLTYYAKEKVVFQGWSWRYADDPRGTERGKTQDDKGLVSTPALQAESGVQKLDLSADKTSFTCKYRKDADNRVYVKVKYNVVKDKIVPLPPCIDLVGLKKFVDDSFFDIPNYKPGDEKPVLVPKDQEARYAANELRTIIPKNEEDYKKAKERFLYGLANPTETTNKITVSIHPFELKMLDRNYMYYGGAEYYRYTFFSRPIERRLETIETVLGELAKAMYNNAYNIEQDRSDHNWREQAASFRAYANTLRNRSNTAHKLLQDLVKLQSEYINYLEYYANK